MESPASGSARKWRVQYLGAQVNGESGIWDCKQMENPASRGEHVLCGVQCMELALFPSG